MKRTTTRIAIASAMTAAIALGTVSAAEAHAPKPSHAREHENRDAKKLAALKSHVARDAAHKAYALDRAERKIVRAELGDENTTAIKANIATDKAALVTLSQNVAAATTLADAYKVAKTVSTYRPEAYEQVRYILRSDNYLAVKAAALNTTITALSADAQAKQDAGTDVSAAQAALADATTLTLKSVAAAGVSEDKALTVHANTPKRGADSALAAAKVATRTAAESLGQAAAKVEVAKAALAGTSTAAAQG